ncbi:MAG: GIY-YIG nuclease family protein [Candidatus Harrisonbacteria bacterium]|nr:GIY-YIG nuclease family protein [Candidatus Harrisonbacteria bacterium]MBI2406373.1 GIY-YIG nuclease family protein [Candidatus Harrisonbacteria bacterium]MBI2603984.1 GIY-YIG nuclease family protein [Candidatus Harrisonbacteria bacterium]MBI3114852.1 GIY-YIG nuclease family protein [Candidatus Harrisonbacteria bacterium]
MYALYVLYSESCARHYIGITKDVKNRVAEHNAGEVRSTKAYRPWSVVRTEIFPDKTSARKREIFLKKNARARKDLFENIHHGPIV